MRELAPQSTNIKTVDVVAAWLTLPDDRIQLQRRPIEAKHDPYKLALFGGKVDRGEAYEEALLRELGEELVLSSRALSRMRLSLIDKFPFDSSQTRRNNLVVYAYEVPIVEPIPALDGDAEIHRLMELSEMAERQPEQFTLGATAVIGHFLARHSAIDSFAI